MIFAVIKLVFPALLLFQLHLRASFADENTIPGILTLNGGQSPSLYTTICNKYTYFQVNMTDACKDLTITVFPKQGEPDIYVMKEKDGDIYPTSSKLTWASFTDGVYNLVISHWDPESSPGLLN